MFKILKGISALLLIFALGSLPYDYYTILRVIVCVTSIWCTLTYYQRGQEGLAVVFGIMALLFNPISPINLDRSIWTFIDLGGAGVFIYSFVMDQKEG